MAEIILDLSGIKGLMNGHAGDTDMVTPQPNLRLAVEDGDMAGGLFNPYLRRGYLAPTTTTSVAVTTSSAPNSEFIASEVDQISGATYWADNLRSLYLGSDLNDTSLTRQLLLEAADVGTYPDRAYDALYDMQLYQLNGERKLFFVGRGLTYAPPFTEVKIASEGTANDYGIVNLSILPSSTTKPSIRSSNVSYTTGANASIPITVIGGTGSALIGVVITEGSLSNILGAAWRDATGTPSYSMTEISSGTGSGFAWKVYALANPLPVTTGEFRSFVSASTSRLLCAFETINTDQSTIVVPEFAGGLSSRGNTEIISEVEAYNKNQLDVSLLYSENASIPTADLVNLETVVDDGTFVDGSFILGTLNTVIYGVQVGVANLDLTLTSASDANWMAFQTPATVIHELPNNYAFMRTADNGFAYLFAGHRVHKIDGTITGGEEGLVTKDVLLFPDNFQVTDAVDFRSRMYVAIHQYPVNVQTTSLSNYRGNCGIYVWNRVSVQLSSADYIELPGVREIKKIYVSPDGVLKLITINEEGITEVRQFGYNDSGGVVFPVIRELGIGAYPQVPDGLTSAGDKVMWLANDGYVYGEKAGAVTKLHEVSAPTNTTAGLANNIRSGAVLFGSGVETADNGFRTNKQGMFISHKKDSTTTNEKIYPFDLKTGANGNQTPHQGDVYTAVNYIPITSVLRRIRIYNAPTANGGTDVIATIKIYFNQKSTPDITKSVTKNEAKRGYVDFNINDAYKHAVQIEVEWATSEPLSGDIYLPSVAIISHDPTTTTSSDNG